ncbi:MAG: phosphatidate cytidylyltransferase [Opitutaceae bacterium]
MNETTRQRLFAISGAFDHPVTVGITVGLVVVLTVASVVIRVLQKSGRLSPEMSRELVQRTRSWFIVTPALVVPVLLGACWTMVGIGILSLICLREFARATGFFRYRSLHVIVMLGILAVTYAVLDDWYGLFTALSTLVVILIVPVAIIADQPMGYIQRVALGIFGFVFFGTCLGHLGYMANHADFRPIILMLFLTVELNDVFAFLSGKLIGGRKFLPNTSPNKTLGGALGALVLTTILAATLGHFVFKGGALDTPFFLIGLGLIISVAGQVGDLMMSSIKRDLKVKDLGASIPGHGGFLDRFDSLILVAPAVFHYVNYFGRPGFDQASRFFTGP